MRVHMMDMGERRYGDCSLICLDGGRVLIDGGHRGDERPVADGGTDLLARLRDLLATTGVVEMDLLVVTHAHADHVGCLPELVASGDLRTSWALVVDEDLSFGRGGVGVGVGVGIGVGDAAARRVAAALREEPLPASAADDEIASAIDEAASLEERYRAMLARIADDGGHVVRLGRSSILPLERALASMRLKVLGPTVDQLLVCADAIDHARQVAEARASRVAGADSRMEEVQLYRVVAGAGRDDRGASDGGGSAAVNDQSIVLALGDGERAVFLGDMQFADPQVAGLRGKVEALRVTVETNGPYGFVRLSHHGAANGTDAALLDALGPAPAMGISGGRSAVHPSAETLDLLDSRAGAAWARTDRNGEVRWTAGTDRPWELSRGVPNDAEPASAAIGRKAASAKPRSSNLAASPRGIALAAGRELPRLLFVTRGRALAERIGEHAWNQAAGLIREAGQELLDVLDAGDAVEQTRRAAVARDGVVLLGGHDVIPSVAIDALPSGVRRSLSPHDGDRDRHVVWSDDPYVSLDGGAPDMPVSRIPDGGDAELVLGALSADTSPGAATFGLRNAERPFAEAVYDRFATSRRMLVSDPARAGGYAGSVSGDAYLMLHGSHHDGTRFWGSDETADAFLVSDVPDEYRGTVFAGCCYGALVIDRPAVLADGSEVGIAADASIALRFLRSGARAFVGASGIHYSPLLPPYMDAAGPLHLAFFDALASGAAPAQALFDAKLESIKTLRSDMEPGEKAIAFKTWRQFCCLGLGW